MIQQLANLCLSKGDDFHLWLLHVLHIGCWSFLDVSFFLQIVEKCLEDFQQVIDIPRLPLLVIHHGEERFDVKAPDIFNILDLKFLLHVPLQILQLLLVIADGLGRQFPHLTVETVLSNSIRKVHTKTPFFRLFTVGKRG